MALKLNKHAGLRLRTDYGAVRNFGLVLWLMLLYRGVPLPTVANPSFPGGGFVGESKAEILALAMRQLPQWVAPFVTVDRAAAPGKLYLNYNASVQETWLKDPAGYIKLADAKFAALFKKRAPHPPAGDDS